MAGYSRSKRPLTSQVHGDPQLEEEDEYSNGLEPNLEDFAGSLKRDNVAGASENSIVDMTGVEVMGPNAAAHKQDEATREFAAGEVVDAADEAGGNVTEDLIDADAQ